VAVPGGLPVAPVGWLRWDGVSVSGISALLDVAWFRAHIAEELLPRWLAVAPTPEGLLLPHVDARWRPVDRGFSTIVSQGRLVHNFAAGHVLTGDEGYRTVVRRGADYIVEHFVDRDFGGVFWSVGRGGRVLEDYKDAYGHAFALFGLASAAACTGDDRYAAAAESVWRWVEEHLADDAGGLAQRTDREGIQILDEVRSQNPVMHMFEALLWLSMVPGMGHMTSAAQGVGDFITGELMRADGALPETYDPAWRALPDSAGGWINIGHLFEWAFLLSRAVEVGLPSRYAGPAAALLEFGLAHGMDADGGVRTSYPVGGGAGDRSRPRGWWEQCEATRALAHHVAARGRGDLAEALLRNVGFWREHFTDPEVGGWYPHEDARNADKGNEWKVDYHVVAMCSEVVRLASIED